MILINVPVWGERFVQLWTEISAWCLLAPNNLPKVARNEEVRLEIVTSSDDFKQIQESEAVRQISNVAQVNIRTMSNPTSAYIGMTTANVLSLREAAALKAKFCYSLADQIWSDGSLGFLASRLNQNRAVFSWAGILDWKQVDDQFRKQIHNFSLKIPAEKLAELLIKVPHNVQRNWIVESTLIPSTPTSLIWLEPESRAAVVRSHILGMFGINFARISEGRTSRFIDMLASGRVIDDVRLFTVLLDDLSGCCVVTSSNDIATASLDDDQRMSLNSDRNFAFPEVGENLLLESLRKHRRWEPDLGRKFFSIPYVLEVVPAHAWVGSTVAATSKLEATPRDSKSILDLMGFFWVSISLQKRNWIIGLLRRLRLLDYLAFRFLGHKVQKP